MKKLFSFMAIGAIMVAMFASCSDDGIGKDGPGDGIDGGEAFFSFKLSQPDSGAGTRAAGEFEAGTEEERKVNDVVVLLYDATGADATLRYKFELEAYNDPTDLVDPGFQGADVATGSHVDPTAIGQIQRFISTGRKVRYQDYQMVVLINYLRVGPGILARKNETPVLTRGIDDNPMVIRDNMIEDVSKLSDINDVFESSDVDYYKHAGFFMSNANGVVPVSKTQLKDSKEAAEAAPVQVNVDRLLAKVRLYTDFPVEYIKIDDDQGSKYITPAGLTITDLTGYLNVTNRSSYLIRQYAPFADANAGGTGLAETYANSVTTSRRYIYAQDYNHDAMSSASAQDLEDQFDKAQDSWSFRSIPVYDVYDLDESYGQYVLENTMSLADQAHANYLNYTTHYLIRATLFPKGFAGNYYSYTNTEGEKKVFTHEEALEWLSDDKFPFDMTGLKAILTAINSDPDELDFNPSTTYPDPDDWSADDIELLTEKGITYHPGGLNIYAIPIKHFQPVGAMANPRNDLYGHYGIVRNNVYNVRITSIDGPGTGGSGYISADITINEWYIRDQEEDI